MGNRSSQPESMNVAISIIIIFIREAIGGAILGLIAGYMSICSIKETLMIILLKL